MSTMGVWAELVTIVTISVALAMDALAVSIVAGTSYRQLHVRYAVRMAVFFGVFQGVMPLSRMGTEQRFEKLD